MPLRVPGRVSTPLLALLLAALTFAVFSPVVHNGFINLDDDKYITENAQVLRGLTTGTSRWALTSLEHANWYPLRRLSHLVDVSLFGTWAGGHHLVSSAWHAAAAGVLFLALAQMTGARWRSLAVAGLFGVHPLQVESVAWAAERSNVQAGLFFAVTLLLWANYVRRPGAGRYLAVLAGGLLSLVAKPMLMTLPFILLLLDIWPLSRLGTSWRAIKGRGGYLLLEKVPLLAFAVTSGAIAIVAHRRMGALESVEALPLGVRFGNAAVAYWRYLGKMLWPADLAVFYPHPGRGLSPAAALTAGLLLAAVTAAAIFAARRRPWLGVGWFWYAGTLLPMSGIVQFGSHAMADRFAYIPCVGIFLAGVWCVAEDAPVRLRQPAVVAAAAVAVYASLAVATVFQVRLWRDDLSLYSHALAATSDNWLVEHNLGVHFRNEGNHAEAIARFREALRIKPDYADAQYNLGTLLANLGETAAATTHLQEAVRLDPADADAHAALGRILSAAGQREDSLRHYRAAALLRPTDDAAVYNLGNALARLGRREEALAAYREALRLRPESAAAHTNAGMVLVELGRYAEAEAQYREALRLQPDQAEARANLVALQSLMGRQKASSVPHSLGPDTTR